jgi:hypothetical protein
LEPQQAFEQLKSSMSLGTNRTIAKRTIWTVQYGQREWPDSHRGCSQRPCGAPCTLAGRRPGSRLRARSHNLRPPPQLRCSPGLFADTTQRRRLQGEDDLSVTDVNKGHIAAWYGIVRFEILIWHRTYPAQGRAKGVCVASKAKVQSSQELMKYEMLAVKGGKAGLSGPGSRIGKALSLNYLREQNASDHIRNQKNIYKLPKSLPTRYLLLGAPGL